MERMRPIVFWSLIIGLYLLLHIPGLTLLPVFADESIYIRWSQLILSDWQQYLFFPLNDGKTPLFIWMMMPFLSAFSDPVWSARLVAVLGGLVQLILIVRILKVSKVHLVGQLFAAGIVILAPFWFFHHRMALMDGWLTVWLSLSVLSVLELTIGKQQSHQRLWIIIGALSVAAGLMTKVPFVLGIPGLLLLGAFAQKCKSMVKQLLPVVAMVLGGVALFLVTAILPVFPQLFARGSDFLLPVGEVLAGRWRETIPSIPTYLGYFITYLGWGVLSLAIISLVSPGKRRLAATFGLSFILFCLPIWVLGKVVYPRYLFPATLFLTLMAGIGANTLWRWSLEQVHTRKRAIAIRILLALFFVQIVLTSLQFVMPSLTDTANIPFVSADTGQYLTTWSSGHGLRETYAYLQELRETNPERKVVVATEGNFGSLPDGLLLYNHTSPLDGVWIEGIGYPVESIPVVFFDSVKEGDQVLLVVNSDRLLWELDPSTLLKEYCRPLAGPCLQVWDITEHATEFKKS